MSKVSVIIPTYNRARFIKEALDSAIKQTYKDIEIIVVDDGSIDDTKDILSQYIKKYPDRVMYFYQKNKGVSYARNLGIRKARGEYIAFLDSDDIWLQNKLEEQIREIKKNIEYGLVCSYVEMIDESGAEIFKILPGSYGSNIKDVFLNDIIITPTVLTKKSCLLEVGGFNEQLIVGEDYDLWLRIVTKYKFFMIPEILARVRRHKNRLSESVELQYKNHLKIYIKEHSKNRILSKKEYKLCLSQQYYRLARHYIEFKNYKNALVTLILSVFSYPSIGMVIYSKGKNRTSLFLLRLMKPYIAISFCSIAYLLKCLRLVSKWPNQARNIAAT